MVVLVAIAYLRGAISGPVALPDQPLKQNEYRALATARARRDGVPIGEQDYLTRSAALRDMLLEKAGSLLGNGRSDVVESLGEPDVVRDGSLLLSMKPMRWRDIMAIRHPGFLSHPGLSIRVWAHRYPNSLSDNELLDAVTYDVMEQERAQITCVPDSATLSQPTSSLAYLTGRMLGEYPDFCWSVVIELGPDDRVVRAYVVWLIEGLY